jgi:DNA-binding response OmpR family regulator
MPHLLIVDDDRDARPMLAAVLHRPHRTIDVAAHGEEALERVKQRKPDLILTDVVMPRMNGWAFVRRLRTETETAFIPVIFVTGLASEDNRIRGFRLGADDYICKPINPVELELRVENALHHARQVHHPTKPRCLEPALEGSLAQFGLASVVNLLALERRSGVLTAKQNECKAVLHVRDGRIIRARFEGIDGLESEECVYALLDWSHGHFVFSEQPVDCEDELRTSTAALLLEAARRMDDPRS